MGRQRRAVSSTKLYHVVLKSLDSRMMVHDDEDKEIFVRKLFEAQDRGEFRVVAYCLMDNHFHLIIRESERLGKSIKRFTVSYVSYYHDKYGTTGHFFENRYYSEPIESEDYLYRAVRYVHQNPQKAGMVKGLADYQWSSYREYLKSYDGPVKHLLTGLITNNFIKKSSFEKFHLRQDAWFELDKNGRKIFELKKLIQQQGYETPHKPKVRDYLIVLLNREGDVKGSQIAAALDMDVRVVYRVLENSSL